MAYRQDLGDARQRIGKGPRAINFVSFLVFLGVVAVAYCLWKFFPVYFQAWQVDSAIADGAANCYHVIRLGEPARTDAERDILNKMKARLVALGVTDPNAEVTLEYHGEDVTSRADYVVSVAHPYVNKITLVHFHRSYTTNLKHIKWE